MELIQEQFILVEKTCPCNARTQEPIISGFFRPYCMLSRTAANGGGYRGHEYKGEEEVIVDKRRRDTTPKRLWKWMKRRAPIKLTIGHLKSEHRLERNRLQGAFGDALNALLSTAAMNLHKLLVFFGLF
jgi:IS5 family transposase